MTWSRGHFRFEPVEVPESGELQLEAGWFVEQRLQDRQRVGRVVGRQVQQDDVVGRAPVGGHLSRRQLLGNDSHDVRRPLERADHARRRHVPFGRAGLERVAVVDDGERRRRQAELLLQQVSRASRFEVVEAEPTGPQRPRDLGRERHRDEHEDRPGGDHQQPPPVHEAPEALERRHRARGETASPRATSDRGGTPGS